MTDKLTDVDGYLFFRGTMRITPSNPQYLPTELFADWAYNPTTECWSACGRSYAADICEIVEMV